MAGDTLSDVLRTVRLRGAVFYYVSAGEEWAAEAPPAQEIAAAVFPGVEHVMAYHIVTKGSGWAAILGEPPVKLAPGDIVVFPQGSSHVMTSAPGLRPLPSDAAWFYATRDRPKPMPVNYLGIDAVSTDAPPGGRADQPRVRVPGLRCAALQSPDRRAAAAAAPARLGGPVGRRAAPAGRACVAAPAPG